jgi:molecular chaperone HscB
VLDFSRNHFDLFGLPVGYAIDRELLAERFRALQSAVHPDRFASAPDQERRLSMQASTRVNEAFQTLKDPLQRALYLLTLYPDADSLAPVQDTAFLLEQMELRETLAEAKRARNPQAAVAGVLEHIAKAERAIGAELTGLFSGPSAGDLAAARAAVHKLQFLDKCRRDAEALEADLDLGG